MQELLQGEVSVWMLYINKCWKFKKLRDKTRNEQDILAELVKELPCLQNFDEKVIASSSPETTLNYTTNNSLQSFLRILLTNPVPPDIAKRSFL